MADPSVRADLVTKARELLALRVDANGHSAPAAPEPVDLAPAATPDEPTAPRTPAPDPSQGVQNAGMPVAKTNAELIAEIRRRAGY